jgi:MFS family permease
MKTANTAREPRELNKLMFVKLMPLLIIAYVLSFLDRTNIALAKHHLDVDLGISAAAYGLGAGLFFLTYALSEIPSNLIMHKVGARFWIARIMVTWGLISAAMAFVQGETSFYILRLLLGIAEAGLFPGVMLYLTYWFNREQRARATGYFLLGVCFANIIGGVDAHGRHPRLARLAVDVPARRLAGSSICLGGVAQVAGPSEQGAVALG